MKLSLYKRCHASFPCKDKVVKRFGNGKQNPGFYHKLSKPHVLCMFNGSCNQQHNNVSHEEIKLMRKLLKEMEQS